ncbi:MAG: universal stress protein, partial [Armatimonadetes bacterium]|nr:universal stress protein [Armatimonadota bacterium]
MKCVVGIDYRGLFERGAALLAGLAPSTCETVVVRVIEPVVSEGVPGLTPGHPVYDLTDSLVKDAESHVDEEAAKLAKSFAVSDKVVLMGDPGIELARYADENDADLVVVGSEQKSFLASIFLGSTTRSLAIYCPCSVLFGKSAPKSGARLVWATDLSVYNKACLRKFLSWNPSGVKEVVVVHSDVEGVPGEIEELEAFANSFSPLGAKVSTVLSDQEPAKALDSVLLPGDLLVVGAAGHGFMERALLGSVSFHQVVHTQHNVLVMRVP